MSRTFTLIAVLALAVGCSRYTSRGQGPFAKPMPSPYAGPGATPPAGPQPNRSNLGIASPAGPATGNPPDPEDMRLVPPKPPEMPTGFAVNPPQPPRPPVVTPPPSGVVPAAATDPLPKTQPTPSPAAINLANIKKLAQTAAAKWQTVDTYEARLVRREVVGKTETPTEEIRFRYKKEPHSVHMLNTGGASKGREVVYVKGRYGDKLHVKTGLTTMALSPDSPMVTSRSRQSIRDAGFGRGIAGFTSVTERIETGKVPPDTLRYLGAVQRPEYPYPLEGVVQNVRPDEEKHLPAGGSRQWFFDGKPDSPSLGLPVLVITRDQSGREVEYYCFDQFRLPAGLTDADFNPDRLKQKK